MQFASLGSGSAGNCMVVQAATTKVLLDCGFGVKETLLRLQKLDIAPEQISGILVTHEHDDHAKGAFKLAAKFNIPVWLTHGTLKMCERYIPENVPVVTRIIDSHTQFSIDALEITPYPVPHDAREPTQFVFSDGQHKLGVLTDAGSATQHIEQVLSGCDALVLECNHDLNMLEIGPYG
jgi:phosphoribosyl 1,2-cyclic phosphodiesterase